MTIEDLASASKAQLDRATAGNPAGMRQAVVTATSPFTISMNGTSIPSPPKSPNYIPIVGDTVLVLVDGAAPYVLERINTLAQPIGARVRRNVDEGISASTMTQITHTTVMADAYSFWDGGNKLVVPAGMGGLYHCSGRVMFGSTGTMTGIGVFIGRNGALMQSRNFDSRSGIAPLITMETSQEIILAAGDYIELWFYVQSGTASVFAQAQTGSSATAPAMPTLECWRIG